MDDSNAPETHDINVCNCRDCYTLRWEYWQEKGQ